MAIQLNLKEALGSQGDTYVNCTFQRTWWSTGEDYGQVSTQIRIREDGTLNRISGDSVTYAAQQQWAAGTPLSYCNGGYDYPYEYAAISKSVERNSTGLFEAQDLIITFFGVMVVLLVVFAAWRAIKRGGDLLSEDTDGPVFEYVDDEGRDRWQMDKKWQYRMDQ